MTLLWLLAACQGPAEVSAPPLTSSTAQCTSLTWERDIKGFFANWCIPCHSENIEEELRQGAPTSVNLDTLERVRSWSERVRATALQEADNTMPPAGGTTPVEREQIVEWIDCGMPGTEVITPPPCEAPQRVAGDLHLADVAEATAFCDQGEALLLEGDLTVNSAETLSLPCLCATEGSVQITQGGLSAPQLSASAGGMDLLSLVDEVDLPALRRLGGDLKVSGTSLARLSLPTLREVPGDLLVEEAALLTELDLPFLEEVGGEVHVAHAPALSVLSLPRLRSTGGTLHLEGLPTWHRFDTLTDLETVGGDVIIEGTGVVDILDLRGTTTITGDLLIQDNPELVAFNGLWLLERVGEVTLRRNPRLEQLRHVLLLERASALTLVDNPMLRRLDLPALSSVQGDVALVGLDLDHLQGLSALSHIQGDLLIDQNPALDTLADLEGLTQVDQDLRVTDNISLPTSEATDLVDRLGEGLGGAAIIEGNAP